jgi:hypothetical protein
LESREKFNEFDFRRWYVANVHRGPGGSPSRNPIRDKCLLQQLVAAAAELAGAMMMAMVMVAHVRKLVGAEAAEAAVAAPPVLLKEGAWPIHLVAWRCQEQTFSIRRTFLPW